MRSSRILFPIVMVLNAAAVAQVPTMPTPTPSSGQRANPVMADNINFDRLRSIEMMNQRNRIEDHPLLNSKTGIYRKPSQEETEALAVGEPLLVKHAEFLKGSDTGIVKLNAEYSCISVKDTIVASEKCLPYKMPGAGAAFSFRTESYRVLRLADVILLDGVFRTGGIFQHVVMASLGDVALAGVTLNTKGMKYLVDLKPSTDGDEFTLFDREILEGVRADGFLYRKAHTVKPDSTYALRSIAYKGNYMRTVDGIVFDELDFDKRRDVIVAFRVIDLDAAGNVTIIWKRLKDTESPRLKIKK